MGSVSWERYLKPRSVVPSPLAASRLASDLRRAVAEARSAYEFVPNSFTYSCLSSCLAAEAALDVLREALEADQMEGDAA
jgi:hypothetical protein